MNIASIQITLDKSHLAEAVRTLSPVLADILKVQHEREDNYAFYHKHDGDTMDQRDNRTPGMEWVETILKHINVAGLSVRSHKMCTNDEYREYLVQVAALTICAIQAYDREKERLLMNSAQRSPSAYNSDEMTGPGGERA